MGNFFSRWTPQESVVVQRSKRHRLSVPQGLAAILREAWGWEGFHLEGVPRKAEKCCPP